jgi:hypothetical protein
MSIKHAFAAAIFVAALGAGCGATAQTIEFGPGGVRVGPGYDRRPPPPARYDDGISEREALRIARRQGVEEVDRVRPTPRGWVVGGTDRNGDDIRVVISRYGEVIDVR